MQIREAAKVRNRQTTWYVQSETYSMTQYIVHNKRNSVSHHKVWTCNCLSFTEREQFRNGECKHIKAVKHKLFMKQAAQEATNAVLSEMTVKQVLDLVVKTLNGSHGRQLWHVLTALRGPDSNRGSYSLLKEQTTAEIRGALGINGRFTGAVTSTLGAFGKNAVESTGSVYRVEIFRMLTKKYPEVDFHFVDHYVSALQALKDLGYIK